MKTALITGGLGFIGSTLAKKLIFKKVVDRCVLLDNFGSFINPLKSTYNDYRQKRLIYDKRFIIERGDANNSQITLSIIQKYKPVYVFHTAALPLAKIENLNSAEASIGSVDATRNLIENLNFIISNKKKYNFERFVYFSSSMIYGDFKSSIVDEKSLATPKEIYGTMKLAGEIITKGLCNYYKINFTTIRPSAVYGPTDMNQRVSQIFIEKAIKGKKIFIQGRNEKLDFTYIQDLVDGVILAATKKEGRNEIFNITNGKGRSLLDFVKILKKYFPNLDYEVVERDNFRPKRGTLSIGKAKKLLGYKPKFTIEKGIKNYLKYLEEIKAFR